MTGSNSKIWEYGHDKNDWDGDRLAGYKVEATDGSVGKIDEASAEVGAQSLVVDAGGWLNSRKVMLPAGLVDRVDHDDKKVYVTTTKDSIKNSPEFDDSMRDSATYRDSLGGYYSDPSTGSGTRI